MNEPHEQPRPRQFGLRVLFLVTLMVAICAAGFAGIVRAEEDDRAFRFILFTIAAPIALTIAMSGYRHVEEFLARRRKRRLELDE